jgi:hypothetical protein
MLLVEQELLTLPEHLSSPPVFSAVGVTGSLVLSVCFVDHQANPSPLYPVLHVQIKLPSVLSQAAFLSQGVDTHSSISIKCQKIDVNSAKSLKG